MRRRPERLTSKHVETLKIATKALEKELMLPGGEKARKNSLNQRLLDLAAEGETTHTEYQAMLVVKHKKYQENATPYNLRELVSAYHWYAYHLSVLRLYYYHCSQQAQTRPEKRSYNQVALDKSTAILEQIDIVLGLNEPGSEAHTLATESKTEYMFLHNTLQTDHAAWAIINTKKREATASAADGTFFSQQKTLRRQKLSHQNDAAPRPLRCMTVS